MTRKSAVGLVNVSKLYQETGAVDGIDLLIPSAGYCCLFGPCGCGKTPTLHMIAGHEVHAPSGANPFGTARAEVPVWSSRRSGAFTTTQPGAFSRCVRFCGVGIKAPYWQIQY